MGERRPRDYWESKTIFSEIMYPARRFLVALTNWFLDSWLYNRVGDRLRVEWKVKTSYN